MRVSQQAGWGRSSEDISLTQKSKPFNVASVLIVIKIFRA